MAGTWNHFLDLVTLNMMRFNCHVMFLCQHFTRWRSYSGSSTFPSPCLVHFSILEITALLLINAHSKTFSCTLVETGSVGYVDKMQSTARRAARRPPDLGCNVDITCPPPGSIPWPFTLLLVLVPYIIQPWVAHWTPFLTLTELLLAITAVPSRSSVASCAHKLSSISLCPNNFLAQECRFWIFLLRFPIGGVGISVCLLCEYL